MTLYIDTSALLKRYIPERESKEAERILVSDPDLVTARHTAVEVRRILAKYVSGDDHVALKNRFLRDWNIMTVVELSDAVCDAAAKLAESTGIRTLDALHLGAAQEAGRGGIPFLTFDVRQARVARSLGWTVLGV